MPESRATLKLRLVEPEIFQNQVVLEKPERRMLVLKSQVLIQQAHTTFLEEAGGHSDALRGVAENPFCARRVSHGTVRPGSSEIGLRRKYMVLDRAFRSMSFVAPANFPQLRFRANVPSVSGHLFGFGSSRRRK